jgi:E3 ubiquitin-protein ligase UBR2
MMTESVARNFQLLFDYVCDDDASAHFSDSMAEVLRKFCTDVYSTCLGVLPDESNINVPVMTWRACAYTIMSLEHCLRDEEKPLFGGLASRQADCVSALIRLSAVSGHVSTSAIVRQHCVTLLAVLVLESSEHRLHEQQRHNILDIDMFHYLVALCLSLPALYVEEDSGAGVARNQLHIVTGRLNDLHVLHLVLAAHVIQIFLTAFVHMNSKDSMEMEDLVSDHESEHLYAVYTDIMNHVSLGTLLVSSPAVLLLYTRRACLPFLRCAALFFHYLTNVPVPAQLTLDASSEAQYDALCQYLGLPTSLYTLLSESDILRRLIPSWCSDPSIKLKLVAAQDSSLATGVPCYPSSVNRLIELPHDYSELINRLSSFTCPSSEGDDSRVPAMCLICGKVICSQSYCCQTSIDGTTIGAATSHANLCGAGTGIFLRVKECQVLLLNNASKGCFLAPPYLDDYGETDQGLKRGNPLHLCPDRYRKLQKLWLSHGVTEEIVHLIEANSSLMAFEWHHM